MTTAEIRRAQQSKQDDLFDRVCKADKLTPAKLATLAPDDLATKVRAVAGAGVNVPPAAAAEAAKAYARRRGSMV